MALLNCQRRVGNAAWCGLLALLVLGGRTLVATEAERPESVPEQASRRLLEALAERGYHDTAILVLDRLTNEPVLSAAFRDSLPLRRAAEQIALIRHDPDLDKRQQVYAAARGEIEGLLAGQADASLTAEAALQRGVLLLEQGRLARLAAGEAGGGEAADLFRQAGVALIGPSAAITAKQAFAEVQQQIEQELAAYRQRRVVRLAERRVRDRLEEHREQVRGRALQVLLLAAEACAERAWCFPQQSPAWREALAEAVARYHEIGQQQQARAAGLWAQIEEGRTLLELGETARGLALLQAVAELPATEPLIERLQVRAVAAMLDAWLATPSLADDAAFGERLRQRLLRLGPPDELDADALTAKLRAAELLARRAATDTDLERRERARLQEDIRRLASDVARAGRDHAAAARDLLASLDRRGAAAAERLGQSFEAAVERVQAALARLRAQPTTSRREEAIDFVRAAIAAGTSVSAEEAADRQRQVHQLRYQLASLFYESQRYHEAAVIGEQLLATAPHEPITRKAATIALASWQALRQQPTAAWGAEAVGHLAGLAEAIMRQWPTDAESATAAMLAIDVAAAAGDGEAIEAVLAGVDERVPARAMVLLRGGLALWQHAERSAGAGGQWRTRAADRLDEGLGLIATEAAVPADTLPVAVAAAVARCNLLLDSGATPDPRLDELLMQPVWGLWTILQNPSAPVPELLRERGLTTCLQGFAAGGRNELAAAALAALVDHLASDRAAAIRLASSVAMLGQRLVKELEQGLPEETIGEASGPDPARLDLLEALLTAAVRLPGPRSVTTWAAVTLRQLGAESGTLQPFVSRDRRQNLLRLAAAATERLLADATGGQQTALRQQLVEVWAELGRWDEALEQVEQVLTDTTASRSVAVQRQAAAVLEASARRTADASRACQRFREAAIGRTTTASAGTAVVWGWGGLASRISNRAFGGSDPSARELQHDYFEARLRLAGCRLAWAEREADPARRRRLLEQAVAELEIEARLHPTLGGEALRAEFEQMKALIQQELAALKGAES